jgi:hypothetical protein
MRGDGMTSLPIIQFGISVSLEKSPYAIRRKRGGGLD